MKLSIPTLGTMQSIDPMEAIHDARVERATRNRASAAARVAARKQRNRTALQPLPSVVGYMRTVQADRRDAELMSSYARASARVNARIADCIAQAVEVPNTSPHVKETT